MPSSVSSPATTMPTHPGGGGLFLSTQEAASVLCMSDRAVRNLVTGGKLHAFRPCIGGRKYLLYTVEVIAYAQAARQPAQQAALANVRRLQALLHQAQETPHRKPGRG